MSLHCCSSAVDAVSGVESCRCDAGGMSSVAALSSRDSRKGKHQRLLRLLWYWAVPIPVKGGGLEMIGVNVLLIVLPSLSAIVADLLLALTGRLCRLRLPVRRRLQL